MIDEGWAMRIVFGMTTLVGGMSAGLGCFSLDPGKWEGYRRS